MHILQFAKDLKELLTSTKSTIGFVPTMGALHEGHLSLIQHAKQENEITVCSIFVNPTQFNDPKDFAKYPITIGEDIEKLLSVGTDILFLPDVKEMYPFGMDNLELYDIGYLDTILDGKYRPGHFNGVCNIVHKLLMIVEPTRLYMGQKDFQQCLVVKRLLENTQSSVELITCPTLRESDGLAMSSRNTLLSPQGREEAKAIYGSLQYINTNWQSISFAALSTHCARELCEIGLEPEYILLAEADSLILLPDFDSSKKMVVLVAAKLEGVRLIDNLLIAH